MKKYLISFLLGISLAFGGGLLANSIRLTTPHQVPGPPIGSGNLVGYDDIDVETACFDFRSGQESLDAVLVATVSTDSAVPAVAGRYILTTGGASPDALVRYAGLDIPPARATLSGAQVTGARNTIGSFKTDVLNSMVTFGVVAGTVVAMQLEVPPTLDFGQVALGQTKTMPLTITNTGDVPVTIEDVSISADGQLVVKVRGHPAVR